MDYGFLRACLWWDIALDGSPWRQIWKKDPHTGLVIIGLFSAWTAFFAETSNQVIFARAGMGLGAALVMPQLFQ